MKIRRHLHVVLLLLLPLMVLRALVPPGYMPVTADGELRIVMCSAGLATSQDPAGSDHHPKVSDTGSCLFAHAATFAPPSVGELTAAIAPEISSELPVAAAMRPPATGPPRTATARAPPSFS